MTGKILTAVSLFSIGGLLHKYFYLFCVMTIFPRTESSEPPCCDLVRKIQVLLQAFSLSRLKSILKIPYWLWKIVSQL